MPNVLPLVPSVPNYRVSTTLDERQYVLDIRWNTRAGKWVMDVLTDEAQPIRTGLHLVLGAMYVSSDPRWPAGLFVAADLSGEGREATLDDMGTRVVVFFYTAAEIAAL